MPRRLGAAAPRKEGLQGVCGSCSDIRAQFATMTWQRIRRRFGLESGRRVRVTPLTRRCRARVWIPERARPTENTYKSEKARGWECTQYISLAELSACCLSQSCWLG